MIDQPLYKTMEEHGRVYDLIWSQMPHMQKRTSSAWWFFILFPQQEEGYGPRQLMFALTTRVGKQINISGVDTPGVDLRRPIVDGVDRFPAVSVGWYCDGENVYEDIAKGKSTVVLSARERTLEALSTGPNGQPVGFELCASERRPLALEAHMYGESGRADFEAWGDLDAVHSSPHESINIDTPFGGTHFVAWRRMNFEGEFDLPGTGRERLQGLGYFQRVCLNVPTFPWKWVWALFPDGSMFSAYVPFVGRHLFRKEYSFYASNRQEQAALSLFPSAFWDRPGPSDEIRFNKVTVTPVLGRGAHPSFVVSVANKQGDWIKFDAVSYGHARQYLARPLLGGRLRSHWDYNEYLIRMENLDGRVQGQTISYETMGQGFGTLEYTWGLGI